MARLADASTRAYRFAVLLLASFLLFGSYFAYDSLGAIVEPLMKRFGVGREAIGRSYTMYSLAAIPTVLLGGYLTDRLGTRRASLLFSTLVTAGASIVAFAPSLWVLYFGRLVFGMGSESLVVAQNAILARWFAGKELALAFGIALTMSRLGTLFTFNTEALLAERYGIEGALWTAAALCLASLLANLVYIALDRRAEPVLGLAEAGAGEKFVLRHVRFGAVYWLLVGICVSFYSAIFPFTALSTDFFHDKWGLPLTAPGDSLGIFGSVVGNVLHMFATAPGTSSIIIFASMVCAPFAGRLVDRIGRRSSLLVLGSFLMVPSHLALGLTTVAPALPMLVLGAAFVLVPAALWPAVPLVVARERVGTAFGLMTMIQNVGLTVFPWVNGMLRDRTASYTASQILFASLGAAGLGFSLLLRRADRASGGRMERP